MSWLLAKSSEEDNQNNALRLLEDLLDFFEFSFERRIRHENV
jgi:hypothetical protein